YPVCLFLFDIMYLKGKSTLNLPLKERRELLRRSIEVGKMIQLTESLRSSELPRIERMMEDAIENGCEGIMVKDIKSVYRAGAREFSWIKIKREYKNELNDTMDLVVVGAFHGMGRRAGNYGTLLVAAYDEDADTFKTVTKIGTGFKDEDLDMFPKLLSKYVIDHRSARVDSNLKPDVWFEPSVVIEVQAQEITLSPIHTAGLDIIKKGSGLALRFPKFTGKVRDDKSAIDATTVKELVEMYYSQRKIRTG
ncbi:MAG: ATP-dependent DNA ligase, partial [Nitrososphaerota archaeon]|nr:ATP-dependent DNA ligase [Nitrososphaerota archaeon]